ncbi:MAG: sulfatase-like hydrolase/transferase [Verrucomicrobiae bacterium]|nr:sulfatase-like hydrolase/transferase [Verrucomicrobiae bacterium]
MKKLLILLTLACATLQLAAAKPNILVILVDDLGITDLGCYGATDLKSPNIDRLAGEGMRFGNFYANCPVCSPSRASLITGRFPDVVGVPGVIRSHPDNSWGYLDPNAVTLPQILKQARYRTGMVGKWHLGLQSPNRPNERGFEWFKGFLGDMMDDYYNHRRHGTNYMYHNEREIDPKGHATDLFTDWAAEYIRSAPSDSQGKPWFLYLAYNAPHTPIQPPEEWIAKVKAREPGITEKRAKLVALIEHMDAGIGKVLKSIRDSGQEQDTLVIFSSDNGGQIEVGANNLPWRDGKQSMYEGGLRVAGIAKWPGHIKAGSETAHTAATMDILPTLAELTGATPPRPIDGKSFLPTLLGKAGQQKHDELYFCRREGNARYQGLTTQALRHGDWKILQNSPFAPIELYNLKNDPYETKDMANANRPVFNELTRRLRLHVQEGGRTPWQPPRHP